MGKFTNEERALIKSIVATLSIKRIPDPEIIKEVYQQTHKTISRITLFKVRKAIKKESYHWYKTMREGQYEYIHEFKERIRRNTFFTKECIMISLILLQNQQQ